MFYRYRGSERIAVDLDGINQGGTLFLLGGGPQLKKLQLGLLKQGGVATLALNNVPLVFPQPTYWLTADRPECFSPDLWGMHCLKFAPISRRDVEVPGTGRPARAWPGALFFGTRDHPPLTEFLTPHRDLSWYRSVFPLGLQLAVRLGFRRVCLVGCGFNAGGRYAWKSDLTPEEADYSQRTYDGDVERLRQLVPLLREGGVELVSCTPGSRAHEVGVPFMWLKEAVSQALAVLPPRESARPLHSSQMKDAPMPEPTPPSPTEPASPIEWKLTEDEAASLTTVNELMARALARAKELEEEAARERALAGHHFAIWTRALCRSRGHPLGRVRVKPTGPRTVLVLPAPVSGSADTTTAKEQTE